MKKRFPLVLCLLLLGGISLASTRHARAQGEPLGVFFDDFVADNLGQPQNNLPGSTAGMLSTNAFINWTVTGGSVDLVGGNVPGATDPALGGRFVDLGGSTGAPGLFQTNLAFNFLAGVSYTVSFRALSTEGFLNAANNAADTAKVTIGSFTFNVSTTGGTFQTISRTFSFATTTTVPLSFQDLGPNDNSGVGIDMVMVAPAGGVPEPSSWWTLLAAGSVLAFCFARKGGTSLAWPTNALVPRRRSS